MTNCPIQLFDNIIEAQMDDLDFDTLARQCWDEAMGVRTLAALEKMLRDRYYMTRDVKVEMKLPSRAVRELGKTLLWDVAI